jgi:hypothetical protein
MDRARVWALVRAGVVSAVFGAVGAWAWVPASAATVTGVYTGIVSSVDAPLTGTFAIGQPLIFNFTYDDSADDAVLDPHLGYYLGLSASGAIGAYTFSGAGIVTIDYDVNNHGDIFSLDAGTAGGAAAIDDYEPFDLDLDFHGSQGQLGSDALPQGFVDPSLFVGKARLFTFYFVSPNNVALVRGNITGGAPIASTPIPAALPLFISALGGLGFAGWRRRRSAATRQPGQR